MHLFLCLFGILLKQYLFKSDGFGKVQLQDEAFL